MKRAAGLLFALCFWAHLAAQSSADDTLAAFRAWRETEPKLERDAATAGDGLTPRTARAAAAEAKYANARAAFLRQMGQPDTALEQSLQGSPLAAMPSPAPAPVLLRFLAAETASLNTNISAFEGDKDPTIRPLQQALDRERAALGDLSSALNSREKVEDAATLAATTMEQRRSEALQHYREILSTVGAAASAVDRERSDWAAYYQKLAEAARATAAAAAAAAAPPPVLTSNVIPNASAGVNPSAPPPEAPRPAPPTITPLPLTRYTGAWAFSAMGGLFHGAEPEFVDLVVHEQNGKATGTFYARFKLPPGSTGDPVARFTFAGDFQPSRIQTFALQTLDGAKGTVQLIPGNALNLLEVNFQLEMRPGKIHLGDILLLKK